MADLSKMPDELWYQLIGKNRMTLREEKQWFPFIGNNPMATLSDGCARKLTSDYFSDGNQPSWGGVSIEDGPIPSFHILSSPGSSASSEGDDKDPFGSPPDRRLSLLSPLLFDLKTSEKDSPPTESVAEETYQLEQMSFANPCFSDDDNEDLELIEPQRVSTLRLGSPSRQPRFSPLVRYPEELRITQVSGGEGSSQQQSTSERGTQEQPVSSGMDQQPTSSSDNPDAEQSSSNTNRRNQAVQTGVPGGGRVMFANRPGSSSSSSAGTASSLAGSSNMSTPRDAAIPQNDAASQFPGTPEDMSVVGLNAVDRRMTEYILASGRATGEAAVRRVEEEEAARLQQEEQRRQEEQRQQEEQRRQEEQRQQEEHLQEEREPLLLEDIGIDITEDSDVEL